MASSQLAPGAPPQPTFASLGRRIAAHLIDGVIVLAFMLAASVLLRLLRAIGIGTFPARMHPVELWSALQVPSKVAVLVVFIVSMGTVYWALFEASMWQATFGKRLLNIYVTDMGGRRIGIGRSFGRSFAKSFFGLFFYLAVVSAVTVAVSLKKRALHDFTARTLVVDGRPLPGGSLELWRITAAFGIPFVWFLVTFVAVFRTLQA